MSFKQSERENRGDNTSVWKTRINTKTQSIHILEDSSKSLDYVLFRPCSWLFHIVTLTAKYEEIHTSDKSTCCTGEILLGNTQPGKEALSELVLQAANVDDLPHLSIAS